MTEIRWALPGEIDKVQQYLHEKMGKLDFAKWRNILDCRWNKTDDKYGVVVVRGGAINGFLGIVFADRPVAGKYYRTGNITSWYLEKDLRRTGIGMEMLQFITGDATVTYTAFSANFRSGALLGKIGWELLDDKRLYWHRRHAADDAGLRIYTGDNIPASELTPTDTTIISQHAGLDVFACLLKTPDHGNVFLMLHLQERSQDDTMNYEILHNSNISGLTANIQSLADMILPEKEAVLTCDSRMVGPEVKPSEYEKIEVSRYYKPASLPASQIDLLYSEVPLLGLKLY